MNARSFSRCFGTAALSDASKRAIKAETLAGGKKELSCHPQRIRKARGATWLGEGHVLELD